MDASEIYSKRLNAKEVIFPKEGEFTFPIADGRIKTPGEEQELRTSTLIRQRPIQGGGHVDFLGESEGSFPQTHDSFPVAGEAIKDFWSMSGSCIYRQHVEPRGKLYSPREESFPIPLKYIDVTRTTLMNLDVNQEKRIDDYWNIDRSRDLSDPWTGFTQFTLLEEKLPTDICGPGGDWRESSLHAGQIIYGQNSGNQWERMRSWRRSKSGLKKSSTLKTLENCAESISSTPRIREFKETIKNARKQLETSVALAMPCKIMKIVGMADLTRTQQNLRVFWKFMNPQECVWGNSIPHHHEDHVAGKGEISLQHYNLVHKIYSYASSYENSWQRNQRWTRNGKNWRKFRRGTWQKSKSKKQVIDEARTAGTTDHFASLMYLVIKKKKCWIGGKTPEIQRSSCSPRWYCKR